MKKCRNTKINVNQSRSIVATSTGKILRRRLKTDGTPECVPMYPYEITSWLSDLSLLDFSGQPVPDATKDDLDPIERVRLRNIIKINYGEASLLELTDDELDSALQLTKEVEGKHIPTITGILLIGKRESIKRFVPTMETSIQVLSGTEVIVNESYHRSILSTVEKIENYFNAWNPSTEMDFGLIRMNIPEFNRRAFREALVNAFCHRDYSMLGRVRVLINDEGLTITNPGGFIEGVTIDNLLYAEPHGRNPVLADALKRIGLAERTGRGIDRIFSGSLFYGRPLPDYSASTSKNVNLFIARSAPDKNFVRMLTDEQSKTGKDIPVDALLILNSLKELRRASIKQVANQTKLSEIKVQATLGRLVESGLVEAIGSGKSRNFLLSSKLYRDSDNSVGYVRQTDIDKLRSLELILALCKQQGEITKSNVVELLHVNERQAYTLLKKLVDEGKLVVLQKGHYAKYGMP